MSSLYGITIDSSGFVRIDAVLGIASGFGPGSGKEAWKLAHLHPFSDYSEEHGIDLRALELEGVVEEEREGEIMETRVKIIIKPYEGSKSYLIAAAHPIEED